MTINITDRAPSADRERREQLGLSVDDLAARAGISAEELSAYEHAKSEADANPTVAMKIGDALDAFESEISDTDDTEAHPT